MNLADDFLLEFWRIRPIAHFSLGDVDFAQCGIFVFKIGRGMDDVFQSVVVDRVFCVEHVWIEFIAVE